MRGGGRMPKGSRLFKLRGKKWASKLIDVKSIQRPYAAGDGKLLDTLSSSFCRRLAKFGSQASVDVYFVKLVGAFAPSTGPYT